MLCNACGLNFNRPKKPWKPSKKPAVLIEEQKEQYLKEAKDFGESLAQQLNEPIGMS
jgi:hypothetical protein